MVALYIYSKKYKYIIFSTLSNKIKLFVYIFKCFLFYSLQSFSFLYDLKLQLSDYYTCKFSFTSSLFLKKSSGWTFCPVDIMDEHGTATIPVKDGRHLKTLSVGKSMLNYDSMLVLTHFKGHAMGGFGGSIKNIAIGCADGRIGKAEVHGQSNPDAPWEQWPAKERFMENMVESAKATCDHFGKHITFINVLRNMSVDCDCAGVTAAKPTIPDIGIFGSVDIEAVDQASIDAVFTLPGSDNHDLKERIESRRGLRQLSYGEEMKLGNRHYKIVDLDKN